MGSLVLNRKAGEYIMLTVGQEKILISPIQIKGKQVKILVEASPNVKIDRKEWIENGQRKAKI